MQARRHQRGIRRSPHQLGYLGELNYLAERYG